MDAWANRSKLLLSECTGFPLRRFGEWAKSLERENLDHLEYLCSSIFAAALAQPIHMPISRVQALGIICYHDKFAGNFSLHHEIAEGAVLPPDHLLSGNCSAHVFFLKNSDMEIPAQQGRKVHSLSACKFQLAL